MIPDASIWRHEEVSSAKLATNVKTVLAPPISLSMSILNWTDKP